MTTRPIWISMNVVGITLLAGCAAYHAHASDAPTTAPAASSPTPDATLKLADATSLTKLETDAGAEANVHSKLRLAKGGTIYFGALETRNDDDDVTSSIPIIARRDHGAYSAIRIDDPRLRDADWSLVAAGPNRGEIWGVLDAAVTDEHQPQLVLAHTTDGGDTWSLSAIHKPVESADFDSFCLGPDGHGRVTLYVSGEDASIEKPGYYHLRTSDGGKTWSKPEYEPDALVPSQSVDEDEEEDTDHPGGVVRHIQWHGFNVARASRP